MGMQIIFIMTLYLALWLTWFDLPQWNELSADPHILIEGLKDKAIVTFGWAALFTLIIFWRRPEPKPEQQPSKTTVQQ
jgi:hypothetical protein